MINRLRRKFILISTVSVFSVVLCVFILMTAFNISSMNRTLDMLADHIAMGGGRFPDSFGGEERPDPGRPKDKPHFDFITPETPFSTRHFTVWLDESGDVSAVNTEFIYSITQQEAAALAARVSGGKHRGWISCYRYRISETGTGISVVFIDGSMNRASLLQSMTIAAAVLIACAALVLFLIVLLSKRVVKPIAESYEKQKQFVTDANHELKTPLTLILANLDIAETELGKNEWLDDIRAEGYRMSELVNRLVALSRMDEESRVWSTTRLALSEIVADVSSEFKAPAESKGKSLSADIEGGITLEGDEEWIRRLIALLLDNAVKYCDAGGHIRLSLFKKRKIVFTVENDYTEADSLELDKLFDRFYRADKARTFTGGFGIGLSLAQSIVQKHRGEISAYRKDDSHIGFKVSF